MRGGKPWEDSTSARHSCRQANSRRTPVNNDLARARARTCERAEWIRYTRSPLISVVVTDSGNVWADGYVGSPHIRYRSPADSG